MDITDRDQAKEGGGTEMPKPWQQYRERRLIRSAGRTLLSDAFSNYMALTAGISPLEIASAFDAGGNADDRDMIQREIHFLTGIFVEGRIKTFARLSGGGEPSELPASAWEIDDAVHRFATTSLNVELPHDPSADATHWIFVDNVEWDLAMDGLRENHLEPFDDWDGTEVELDEPPAIDVLHAEAPPAGPADAGPAQSQPQLWRNEMMSIEAVISATGLKRSTIYAKVAAGSFPRQIAIHGTRIAWRRGAVQDWLDGLPR